MADTKITALTAITTVDPANDVLPIVDVSDTSMAASGTTKKITTNQLLGASGTATLASATISGDLTVRTNKLKVDATGVAIGATSATYLLDVRGTDTTNALIAGTTKGIRFVASASTSSITGVDNTGAASYQPLSIGGSALDFSLSGSTAMTLNSTGLGVGVSPSYNIHARGTTNGRIQVEGASGYGMVFIQASSGYAAQLQLNSSGGSGRRFNVYSDSNGLFGISDETAVATRLAIDSSGNVGIGVTPSAWGAGGNIQGTNGFIWSSYDASIGAGYYYASGSYKYISTAAASIYQPFGGTHKWFTAAGGQPAGTNFTPTQAMTLNANGALALQGGNTSANGVGIAFPATQVASSDANTLDDYKESTWTGTLVGTTTNPTTPVTATGRYTKIGRQVSVQIQFTNVDTTGASGQIKVTGLPASIVNNSSVSAIGSVLLSSIGTFTGSPAAFIGVNTTEIELYSSISGGGAGLVTHNAGASRSLYINITYTV